ncbi:MAG: methyltransferase [Clostridiales bacterium]|nr:methyltransferase [Clostridiales bacterium]
MVGSIPSGYVMSYGQVAALAGNPRMARQVGWALHALKPGSTIPWQRVVTKDGRVTKHADMGENNLQKLLLLNEGVAFDVQGQVEKKHFFKRNA